MRAGDIEAYLADLGWELQQAGLPHPIRILLVGGAFMLTQVHNRPATNDVDVLLLDITDPTTSPLYPPFRAAVRTVASRHRLPVSWLNDVVGDALRNNGPIPPGTLWRTYDMLEVFVPPDDYMLALKLFAGRPKDLRDIQALCQHMGIQTRDQAQQVVDLYIPDRQLQQLNHLDMTLGLCFP